MHGGVGSRLKVRVATQNGVLHSQSAFYCTFAPKYGQAGLVRARGGWWEARVCRAYVSTVAPSFPRLLLIVRPEEGHIGAWKSWGPKVPGSRGAFVGNFGLETSLQLGSYLGLTPNIAPDIMGAFVGSFGLKTSRHLGFHLARGTAPDIAPTSPPILKASRAQASRTNLGLPILGVMFGASTLARLGGEEPTSTHWVCRAVGVRQPTYGTQKNHAPTLSEKWFDAQT